MRRLAAALVFLNLLAFVPKSWATPLNLNSTHEEFASALVKHGGNVSNLRWYVVGKNGFVVQSTNNRLVWSGAFLKTALADLNIDSVEVRQLALEFITLRLMYNQSTSQPSFFHERVRELYGNTDSLMRSVALEFEAQRVSLSSAIAATNAVLASHQSMAQFLQKSIRSQAVVSASFDKAERAKQAEIEKATAKANQIAGKLEVRHLEDLSKRFTTNEEIQAQLVEMQKHYSTQTQALEDTRRRLVEAMERTLSPDLSPELRAALLRDLTRQTIGPVDAHIASFNRRLRDTTRALQRTNAELARLQGIEQTRREQLRAQIAQIEASAARERGRLAYWRQQRNQALATYGAEFQSSANARLALVNESIAQTRARIADLRSELSQIQTLRRVINNAYY